MTVAGEFLAFLPCFSLSLLYSSVLADTLCLSVLASPSSVSLHSTQAGVLGVHPHWLGLGSHEEVGGNKNHAEECA